MDDSEAGAFRSAQERSAEWLRIHEQCDKRPPDDEDHFRRLKAFFRSARFLSREHAGTLVSAAGIVAALGAALVAVGLVQDGAAREPLSNGWILAGTATMVLGVVLAVGVVVGLVSTRIRDERLRHQLAHRIEAGESLLRDFAYVGGAQRPFPEAEMDQWHKWTATFLMKMDPSRGLVLRFTSTAGLAPAPLLEGASDDHQRYYALLVHRMTRLHEMAAGLAR